MLGPFCYVSVRRDCCLCLNKRDCLCFLIIEIKLKPLPFFTVYKLYILFRRGYFAKYTVIPHENYFNYYGDYYDFWLNLCN